mmetsp:Transcript_33262/g.69945  ORF Transcript_33262/g.69945 Transcript_33262/m.69945 type:complete len:264 (-) Transcript_33262:245-1036(-)
MEERITNKISEKSDHPTPMLKTIASPKKNTTKYQFPHNCDWRDQINLISTYFKMEMTQNDISLPSNVNRLAKGINYSASPRHSLPNKIKSNHPKENVTFCDFITVNTFPTHTISSNDFEQKRQKEMTRVNTKDTEDTTTSIINTEGKVCIERRIQQRTAILAVLSFQKRLHQTVSEVTPSSEFIGRLSSTSLKLSQWAKDIALETARQTVLEVYPQSLSTSNSVPIRLSEFPEIKRSRKRGSKHMQAATTTLERELREHILYN